MVNKVIPNWIAAFTVPFLIGFLFYKDLPFATFYHQFFPKIQHRADLDWHTTRYTIENSRTSFQAMYYDDLREAERKEKKYSIIRLLSLPTHRIEVPLMEVFVKYDKDIDQFIAREDSSIIAINELGLNLLQDQNVFNGSRIKRTKSEYDRQRLVRLEVAQQQYDSLLAVDEEQADSISAAFNRNEYFLYREYLDRVKSLIKQSFSFEINEQSIPDSTIQMGFHVHPNFGEEGFLCLFPMQNAKLGMNYLTLKRKFYNENKEAYYEMDYTIPFIYTGGVE